MSPPHALHRSEVRALSPGFKIFLSGSILFLGSAGTLPFYQPGQAAPSVPPADVPSVVAALPDGITKTKDTPPIAPLVAAVQTEKYAQPYPEPTLVPKSPPPLPKVPQPPEPVGRSGAKPIVTPIRTFASVHQLAPKKTTPFERQAAAFDEQPESIDPLKVVDALLPLFHFAENLKPLSQEVVEKTPPENPFRQPDTEKEWELSPLRPYIELRPLRITEVPEQN